MADTASKPKKTAAPKKPADHPPVATMVTEAVKALKDRKGSSLAAIKKYIGANYKVDVVKIAPFIRRFLKSAVANGKIVQVKGTGAAGSFKIGKEEKPKKEVKKPKAKKTEAKTTKPKVKKTPKKDAKPKKEKTPKKAKKVKKDKTPKKAKKEKTPKKAAAAKKPKADKKPKAKKTPTKKAAKPAAKKTAAKK